MKIKVICEVEGCTFTAFTVDDASPAVLPNLGPLIRAYLDESHKRADLSGDVSLGQFVNEMQ
jgi:hypothetical protein